MPVPVFFEFTAKTEKHPITRTDTIAMLTVRFTTERRLNRLMSFSLDDAGAGVLLEFMFTTTRRSSTVKNKIVESAYNSGFTPFLSCV